MSLHKIITNNIQPQIKPIQINHIDVQTHVCPYSCNYFAILLIVGPFIPLPQHKCGGVINIKHEINSTLKQNNVFELEVRNTLTILMPP